jgi:tetratricopeptide (TPR) repeat protein
MTIDSYAPCPCGNGKKLKFCKCVEQPQELETIMRLAEGGQELAALDRINQLLAKTPNTAWLLAIKCELSLAMQEYDTFRETAIRFLKLKPDNPLALVMRSMVACNDGEPLENAARYLLQGMSESRETFPTMTLPAIQVLIRSMADKGKLSMVGFWCDVLNSLTPDAEPEEESPLKDPTLNLLAKTPIRAIENTQGALGKERLAEVMSLTRTFRYPQAETKLRAILRDFPDQPTTLSHLLRAQYAQLDQEGAFTTAKKLSENLQISAEERAYYLALAFEIEPGQKSIDSPMVVRYCEVDSDERVHESLEKLDIAQAYSGQDAEQMRHFYAASVNDEVPAKRVFAVYDRHFSVNRAQIIGEPAADASEIAQFVATVVTFGKQTDRPARVLVVARSLAQQKAQLDRLLEALQLGTEITNHQIPSDSPYPLLLRRPKVLVASPGAQLTCEQRGKELVEDFLHCQLPILDNQTVLEASQDERKRAIIRGLLVHLEGEQSFVVPRESIDAIYSRLNLPRPAMNVNPQSENIQLTSVIDLDRIDCRQLSDNQLQAITGRAVALGAYRVYYHCAQEILRRDSLADSPSRVAALSGMISFETTLDGKIKYCTELETALEKANAPVGRVVIQRMGLLQAAGRVQEAQECLLNATKKHPNDPYLLSFMQYIMEQSRGAGGRGPAPMMGGMLGGDDAQESSSGLVLPGQAESQESKSKLWLPGS